MRIAIQDSWPNLPENAEKEFISRFIIACENVGINAARVVTSDDIYDFKPDAVFITHEFSRKLTPFPTIGLQWSPTNFFKSDPYRNKSILSYDGYIAANNKIRDYISDLVFGIGLKKPIAPFSFLPTTYQTDLVAAEQGKPLKLCYVGVHWDGDRHKKLFELLNAKNLCTFYGPTKSWSHLPENYKGKIPFDGRSLVTEIASNGIALCLHKDEHVREDTPSMRIFEALSVGAIVICDQIEFARTNLSEFAYFIDRRKSPSDNLASISAIIESVNADPVGSAERGRRGKEWFEKNWSLETKLKKEIGPFIGEVAESMRPYRGITRKTVPNKLLRNYRKAFSKPSCDIIIRVGGRSTHFLKRAISSIQEAADEHIALNVVVVDYKGRRDLEEAARSMSSKKISVEYTVSPDTGYRSTALWHGIKNCKSDFICHLDDDDTVFPSHYNQLVHALTINKSCVMAYSGVIRREEDEGHYFSAENFAGELNKVIEERSELHFLDHFSIARLLTLDNFIQSNTWIARRNVLAEVIQDDPHLQVGEDVLLYILVAQKGDVVFTGSPTALWHWRSSQGDNSMSAVPQTIWAECAERIKRRVSNMSFSVRRTADEILSLTLPTHQGGLTVQNVRPVSVGEVIEGGPMLYDTLAPRGFYPYDIPGIWTKDDNAQLTLQVDESDRNKKLYVEFEMIGAVGVKANRFIEISVGNEKAERYDVATWDRFKAKVPLPADLSQPVVINVFSSEFVLTEGDPRRLGAFISRVELME